MKIRITTTLGIALAFAIGARAGVETFFGEDKNPIGGPNQVPRQTNIVHTLDAARQFHSRLAADTLTESFESYATGSTPTNLVFGTNIATLSGWRIISTVADPSQTDGGGFPLTGTNVLTLVGVGSTGQFFTIDFTSPQSALGFFCSDVEINRLVLTLIGTNAQRRDIAVPVTVPQGSGGCFYFGVIDRTSPFVTVEFHNVGGSQTDGFAFDDLTIAEQVLPPRLSIRVSPVELCWDTVTNEVYQLQYRSSFTTNGWLLFGDSVVGNGLRFCTNDAVLPEQPQRFYQLVITNSP